MRECVAVREWLGMNAEVKFHTMRDHQFHTAPIMGGLFGCRGNSLPDLQERITEWIAGPPRQRYSRFDYSDQSFLAANYGGKEINAKTLCTHIGYGKRSQNGNVRRLTVGLPYKQFVGQQYDANGKPIYP